MRKVWHDDFGPENQQLRYSVKENDKSVLVAIEIPGLAYRKGESGEDVLDLTVEPDFRAQRYGEGNNLLRLKLKYMIPEKNDLAIL